MSTMVEERSDEWQRVQGLKGRLSNPREREVAANATPQTRRMLMRPVIDRLHEQGKLEDVQVLAAREIERVHLMLTSFGRVRRASFLSEPSGGAGASHVPDVFRADYQDRYRPWATEKARQRFADRCSVLGLTLMMVVDNRGQRQVAHEFHTDQRRVIAFLQEALYRYAEISGWISPIGLPLLARA